MQQFAQAWLALIVDISLKSILLAGVASLLLFMFRVRDTNLRHRVWTAILIGMLTMPALVYVTPAIPLPGWLTFAIPIASTEPHLSGDQPDHKPAAKVPPMALNNAELPRVADADPDHVVNSAIDVRPIDASREMPPAGTLDSQKSISTADNIQTIKQSGVVAPRSSRVPLVLAILYFAVAIAIVVRLVVGLTLTHRLIRQAREIQLMAPRWLPRRRSLRMLETGSVHVPATVGFLRPVVLLPMSWRQWSESKLQAVLAHELAHVRRADWLVITLAELNRALYWFHPVAWIVRRRLSELAEQNCDDAVLEADGNRTLYASYLLEVAASLTNAGSRYRPPIHGIAMACKPNVETRIDAILDAGRPLARRIGVFGVMGLLAIGIPAVLLTSALRTAADDTQRKPAAEMKMKAPAEKSGTTLPSRSTAQESRPTDKTAAAPIPKRLHAKGQVLSPDGKPVAGATVCVAWTMIGPSSNASSDDPSNKTIYTPTSDRTEDWMVAKTKTDAQGNYELTFSLENPEPKRVSYGWKIIALADGFSPAWQRDVQVVKKGSANSTVSFALAKDQPVRGRIVDLEGTPLAGIRVRVHALHAAPSEPAVSVWIQDAKRKPPPRRFEDYSSYAGGSMSSRPSRFAGPFPSEWNDGSLSHGSPALPTDALTDRDGRVEFKGLSANRLAILEIEGPSIAKTRIQVVVRDMETVLAEPRNETGIRAATYFGRDFQFVAEPAQSITGTVKDADTNQPLVNYQVNVERVAGNFFGQLDFLSARTDDQGRYRIDGAPRGGGHAIKVNPTPDQPYFPTEKSIKTASGLEPITCDFVLHRGRWVIGKVTDHDTKAPIKGAMIDCLPLRSNSHAKDYPNYGPNIVGSAPSYRFFTAADGSFRVLAIPGKGVLGGIAMKDDEHTAMKDVGHTYMSLNTDSVPKDLVQANGYLTTYHPWTITGYHAIKEVDVPESEDAAKYDLEFTRGFSRKVEIVDAQGQPVVGVRVLGRVFPPSFEAPASEATIEFIGLTPNHERDVVFIHPERRIGKSTTLSTASPSTVALELCAIARGRVVGNDGQVIAGLPIKVSIEHPDNWSRDLLGASTGKDGRFEVLLAPGTTYRIWYYSPGSEGFSILASCRARAGAVFELGDLINGTELSEKQTDKMITRPRLSQTRTASGYRASLGETRPRDRSAIHGRIIGVDGKPAVGADVAVIARRNAIGRGGDLESRADVLAETKTDSDGRYEIELSGVSSKTHRNANLIARSSGTALAWQRLNLDAGEVEASFDLQPEQRISGRLVDIEGQPAAGVRLLAGSIMAKVSPDEWDANAIGFYFYFKDPHFPTAWPQPITTDQEGRFAIHGVPKEHGVWLQVEGDDRFAPQSLTLNSGQSEQRGKRDGTYRPQVVKNLKPGEEAVLPLAPAQIFTGTVRYEDTGEPAPHARLTVWASQQEFGSMTSVGAMADEKGRYKISSNPGIRFGVTAYPPDGAPYLVREMKPITWEAGARSKEADVRLPRGVLVRGQVLEQGPESPIAGASVQYIPESAHNTHASDGILTGWQDMQLTDHEGRFQIVVLPGPGRLLTHGPRNEFVFQETSEQELYKGRPGGRRNYAHDIVRIDPAPNAKPLEITVRLKRGATVRGELLDEKGDSVQQALLVSRLQIYPFWLNWSGQPLEVMGGRFEISGLAPDRNYTAHFLASKRRLGATITVKAGMDSPRVVLEPCGDAKMRFVDHVGKPVANYEPTVELVVTPGVDRYDRSPENAGTLAAEADFISNVDRANHSTFEKADKEGRLIVLALIPGATYRILTYSNKRSVVSKEFQAVAKKTLDLSDIVVERPEK